MNFTVFQRADGAWLIVPVDMPSPLRHSGQVLRRIGACALDFARLDPDVVFQLGMDGRAIVLGADLDAVRDVLAPRTSPSTQRTALEARPGVA